MDSKPTLVVCGCAMNCSEYIEGVFENIERLKEVFDLKGVIVSYDDSTDDTYQKLTEKKELYNVMIVRGNKPRLECRKDGVIRVVNICNARNIYMNALEALSEKPEYFIVMDMDDVCSGELRIETIKDAMTDSDKWDGLTFDNPRYYDFWALSIRPFTVNCFMSSDVLKTMQLMLKSLVISRGDENRYISCESSFNGFGIYKSDKYINIRYSYTHDPSQHVTFDVLSCLNVYGIKYPGFLQAGVLDCEHRHFNITAKKDNGAVLKIFKTQLFDDYTGEHARWLYDN